MTNSGKGAIFRVYNKATGNLEAGPIELSSIANELPPGQLDDCKHGLGDPIVLYDELAKRWLLSEFSTAGEKMCVYISASDDPTTSDWFAYEFKGRHGFPDYPKFAVWPSAYFVGSNETQPTVYAFDRKAMLAGRRLFYSSPSRASRTSDFKPCSRRTWTVRKVPLQGCLATSCATATTKCTILRTTGRMWISWNCSSFSRTSSMRASRHLLDLYKFRSVKSTRNFVA